VRDTPVRMLLPLHGGRSQHLAAICMFAQDLGCTYEYESITKSSPLSRFAAQRPTSDVDLRPADTVFESNTCSFSARLNTARLLSGTAVVHVMYASLTGGRFSSPVRRRLIRCGPPATSEALECLPGTFCADSSARGRLSAAWLRLPARDCWLGLAPIGWLLRMDSQTVLATEFKFWAAELTEPVLLRVKSDRLAL